MRRFAKIAVRNFFNLFGYDIIKLNKKQYRIKDILPQNCAADNLPRKIQYACGSNFLKDWLNVDVREDIWSEQKSTKDITFMKVDLIKRHPFPRNFFRFGFSEDFLEHLDQCDSIIFLSECYRTLRPGGVLRLSFPGLSGVLKKHYRCEKGEHHALQGKDEAYTMYGHRHFFCKEELALLAGHIGFKKVEFVEYGGSRHPELRNLDTRGKQRDLNIYAELTK